MRTLLVMTTLLIASAVHADAHAELDHANPKVGSTVSPAPRDITLWFTEKVEPGFSAIEVRNEQGAAVQEGKAAAGADGTELRVSLKSLQPGRYRVFWRVLSVDTHRSQGNFTFRVGP